MRTAPRIKDVLVVELNEFSVELLTLAVTQYPLPGLAKVLAFPRSSYKTMDRYNSGYLEPWVQWVSIHAELPSSKHKIKHLGDVPDLNAAQCWETLSQHGVTSGVWGVMNGAKRNAKEAKFFLPDPWTFSEKAYPKELNNLLDLPRYVSKNYQNLSKSYLLTKGLKLLKFIAFSKTCTKILSESLKLLSNLRRFGKKHFVYISYFDMISTLLFTQYKKTYQPKCSIIFLNSLAHLQHHHWRDGADSVTPEILLGLQYIDKIFTHLFNAFPEDTFVVHNGLSQMNTNHERPWVLYRQKDPSHFMKALNIPAVRVEQHMTHDGHVFFKSNTDCEHAYNQLKSATINKKPLFHVELNAADPCKLFTMLKFTDELADTSAEFEFNNQSYRFFDYFDRIVTRTGRHIPIGTVFSDTIVFPDHIDNHDFNKYIYNYLLPEQFSLKEKLDQEELFDEVIDEPISEPA